MTLAMNDFSRRKSGKPAAHPLQWLSNAQDRHTQILAQAKQLIAIEQDLQRLLPQALAAHCHAIQLQNNLLTIAVPDHQYASRLRQITPRLLHGLQEQRWPVEEIQLRIHHISDLDQQPSTGEPTKKLSSAAISAFAELKGELPEGPLAQAIEQLLENHQPK